MDFQRPVEESKKYWNLPPEQLVGVGKTAVIQSLKENRIRWDLGIPFLVSEWKALLSPKFIKEDVVAGLTVACIAIPLSFAIALASGVKPEVGLVTAIVAGIVCALFGGTTLSVSGPAAAMSVLIASVVETHGYNNLLVIGLLCGLFQLLSGILGIGKLIRLVPNAVIAGFTAGIGAIILIGQLPRALGLPPPTQSHVLDVITHIGSYLHDTRIPVLGITLLTIVIMLRLPKLLPKLPAPLVAVVLPTLIVYLFKLEVPLIGDIPRSLPLPTLPQFPENWGPILNSAITVFALASLETLLSSTAIDRMSKSKPHEPNQELIGQGIGNLVVPLFGGIPVTGVIARTALNFQSGAKTRRSSIVHSLTLLAVVFLIAPIMSQIPIAALAGVLLSVALNMLNPKEFNAILSVSKAEAIVYVVTLAVVVLVDLIVGVQAGVAAAVVIGVIRYLQIQYRTKKKGS